MRDCVALLVATAGSQEVSILYEFPLLHTDNFLALATQDLQRIGHFVDKVFADPDDPWSVNQV